MKKLSSIMIAAALLAGCGKSKPTPPSKVGALVMCQSFVKQILKNPASAEFDDIRSAVVAETDREYDSELKSITFRVVGSVVASNSFGGMVNTGYSCNITGKVNGKWSASDVTVN